MVLKIFICPSHIANWSLGLWESMGCDRHPIRALGSFHYQKYLHMFNQCQTILKWASWKTTFQHNLYIGIYGKYPQVDRRKIKRWSIYWGMHPSIGNTWVPVKIRDIITLLYRLGIDPYIILARLKQGAWIETKEMGTNCWSMQDLDLQSQWSKHSKHFVQEVDSCGDPLNMQCERWI